MSTDHSSTTSREILLTNGLTTIVSPEDFDYLSEYVWWSGAKGYAMATIDGEMVYMHHLILSDIPKGMRRDHINRNRLDNRRENLRIVTHDKNAANAVRARKTNPYRGIIREKGTGLWIARIKDIRLGTYVHSKDAALAYDYARRIVYSAPDGYNFPNEVAPLDIQFRVRQAVAGLATGAGDKKYRGTHKASSGTFLAQCQHVRIGLYMTEKDAAHARDRYVIENDLLGVSRHYALNFPLQMYIDDPQLGYSGKAPEVRGESRYIGVARKRDKWRGFVYLSGKQYATGVANTEDEAAWKREHYIIERDLENVCRMNFAGQTE